MARAPKLQASTQAPQPKQPKLHWPGPPAVAAARKQFLTPSRLYLAGRFSLHPLQWRRGIMRTAFSSSSAARPITALMAFLFSAAQAAHFMAPSSWPATMASAMQHSQHSRSRRSWRPAGGLGFHPCGDLLQRPVSCRRWQGWHRRRRLGWQ